MSILATPLNQLEQWLATPEGSHFEFKEAKTNYHFDKLVEYCVALANEGGGKIILGVTDARPRKIVGTTAFAEPGRTEAGLYQKLSHRIPVEEILTPQGRVVVVHVPSRLPGAPWQIEGRYLKRAGDELTGLNADELKWIFAETGPDFSAEICPNATLEDLDPAAVAEFRTLWAAKSGDERKRHWSDIETLANAELLLDGSVTYAALILCGTHAALGRRLDQAEVIFEYRSAESAGPAADRINFREGWLLFHERIWERINLRNNRQSYQDGLFRYELSTFDEQTVREAILNAVAHRDYRLGGSIFVRQFDQRLEVISPGGLPPGITTENIVEEQNPRNRRLAAALEKCGLVERAGQGVNLMYERCVRQGKHLPSFSGTSAHQVRLTLDGLMTSPDLVRFIQHIGESELRAFSTEDFLVLDHLARDVKLPDGLKARLPGLVEAGIIEVVGKGKSARYIAGRRLYQALGEAGVYTRKHGLDRETNKALLEKHLRLRGADGAPTSELQQVLPAESSSAIKRMLYEMRDEGLVNSRGKQRGTRWYLADFIVQDKSDER